MILDIHQGAKHVATIAKQHKAADNYRACEPWLLLHNTGRTDRFATMAEARSEGQKSYAGARFKKRGET